MNQTTRKTVAASFTRVLVALTIAAIMGLVSYVSRLDNRVSAQELQQASAKQSQDDIRKEVGEIHSDVREIRTFLLKH